MSSIGVLSVCTHNRTRSVLMRALLTEHFGQLGVDGEVRAVGFGDPGLAPTSTTVRLLAMRGIDVSAYRSRPISIDDVEHAHLIITAERMHVVDIVGRSPDAFDKTLTLPEIVTLGSHVDRAAHPNITCWLAAVSRERPHGADYLDADIDEIADPTGHSPALWRACLEQVDDLTLQLATMLA